jgi:putative SOS response-associated peptidase YedK
MCARYSAKTPMDAILAALGMPLVPLPSPTPEVRPTDDAALIANHATPRIEVVHWGLFGEDRDGKGRKRAPLINVRTDSLGTKAQFTKLFTQQRCIVLADGFYEWMPNPSGKGRKIPFFIHAKDGGPIALAGLYTAGKDGAARSFALLTTEANALVASVHDRMPVIVPIASLREYLSPEPVTLEALRALLQPAADGTLTMDELPRAPDGERKSTKEIAQLALFGKE